MFPVLSRLTSAVALAGLLCVSTAAAAGPSFTAFGDRMTIEVSSAQSNGAITTLRLEVPPGNGPPAHIHTKQDEMYVVTRGRFRFAQGKRIRDVGAGTVLYLPRNEPHQWLNIGRTGGELILTVMPSGFEQFFMTVANRHLALPRDGAAITALSNAYGIRVVPPLIR
jgi:mannose-6-phosphate isomerase-like protein (cupin superfamily)